MDVNFHLPGLRYNYPLNMLVLSLLKQNPEYFREGIKIASFFGEFPMSLWAGGRLVIGDQCDTQYVRNVIMPKGYRCVIPIPIRLLKKRT